MPYRVKVTDDAAREITHLPGNVRQRVRRMIGALAEHPLPHGARELRGYAGYYRVRLDQWRVIYRVYEADQVVLVLRVRRKSGRPETYEALN